MRTRWVTFDCFGTLIDWHTDEDPAAATARVTTAREIRATIERLWP